MNSETRAITEIFGEAFLESDSPAIKEAFNKVQALLSREDRGWSSVFGASAYPGGPYGLTLLMLQEWGWKLRESIVGAPWIGRGFRLRANYIWEGGIRYGNVPGADGGIQGKKNIQNLIDLPKNQRNFFGTTARRQREERLYTEGIALWIGDDNTKILEAIPLWQISDIMLDPDGLGEVMAYRRAWTHRNISTGEPEPMVKWYFTDTYSDLRVPIISIEGLDEDVALHHTVFDMHANRASGLAFGAPDAVAAFVWNGIARDAVMDGRAMTQALATFAFKASVKSNTSGQQGAISLASPHGAGATFVTGQANDLAPMANAGKAYDFESLQFLVAIIAAALDVSVIHLTSNPSGIKSAGKAAQDLDLPTQLAMMARRDEHIELDKRVLKWMDVKDPDVTFIPYDTGDVIYRSIQSLVMEYQQGTMTRQELRNRFDDLMGRPNGTVPDIEDIPAVQLAKVMATITGAEITTTDTDKTGNDTTKTIVPSGATVPQTGSPTQGRANGTQGGQGGGAASNDVRRSQGKSS